MSDSKVDFLYLNEEEMVKLGVTDMKGCVDSMEEMFRLLSRGDYAMGGSNGNSHGCMVSFPDISPFPNMPVNGPDRRFMAMPAYLGGEYDMAGMKWYGSNVENKDKGLPRSILMLMLNDKETGAPRSLMSANLLSAYRTGAVPGVGAKHLARRDSKVLGIYGPGVMNKTALEAFVCTCPELDTIKIKGRSKGSIESFMDYVKAQFPQFKTIEVAETLEELVRGSDVISMATSCPEGSENYPMIKEEWIKPGAFFSLPACANFEDDFLLNRAKTVVDNFGLYEAWTEEYPYPSFETVPILGTKFVDMYHDGIMPRKKIEDIGDIINGKIPGRKDDDEIILFSIGGMPVEDVAWGTELYRKALDQGVGTKLNLWDAPRMA